MVPSLNFTVRAAPFEAATVAAAKADALDSAAIVALMAGGDKPSAVLPSAEMNRRLPASTVICPSDGIISPAMTERYHALGWRSADVAHSRPDANLLTNIEHEIEPASETVAGVSYPHQQFALKQAIAQVRRFVGEIQLRGE
jgi:hypothetical protein